jgi:phage shock protein E
MQNPETVIVDVRTPKEFEANTAHNAVNIPLAQVENNLDYFWQQKNVVLFCNSGNQSNQALQILKKNGINNIHDAKRVKIVKSLQKQ